VPISEYSAAR